MNCWAPHSFADRLLRGLVKNLRKDDKYRFSLQWSGDTQERVAAGELLEKLGNKKSDFIVLAIWEYIQQHPEAIAPGVKIRITSPNKNAVRAYMEENHATPLTLVDTDSTDAGSEKTTGCLSEDDLNDMLENLSVFGS